jgi:hypothetical protein
MARDSGGGRVEERDRSTEIEWNGCVQRKNEGARDSRTCSGSRTRRDRAEAGAGASAARVATAAELGQRKCDMEDARAGQHGVGGAAARQGSDAWVRQEAEGGAKVAATAGGGEAQFGQAVGRSGEARRSQREAGKRRGRGWGDTWTGAERR